MESGGGVGYWNMRGGVVAVGGRMHATTQDMNGVTRR